MTASERELRNAVAVVTGGARGLGRAAAARLAAAGAAVAVVDLDAAAAKDAAGELGERALGLGCDVADEDEVAATAAEVLGALGTITVLVNAAGISRAGPPRPVHETTLHEWRRVLDVNLTGTFLWCRAVLPGMVEAGGGSIVNLASSFSFLAAPLMGPYAASKGGVLQLTRNIARDYAAHGVRANAVCPGFIDTPMLRADFGDPADPGPALAAVIDRTFPKRLGSVDEVAEAVLFLASPRSSYCTGSALVVDGGFNVG